MAATFCPVRLVAAPDRLLPFPECAQSSGERHRQMVAAVCDRSLGWAAMWGGEQLRGHGLHEQIWKHRQFQWPDPTTRSLRMLRQVQQTAVQVQSATHSNRDTHPAAILRDSFGQPAIYAPSSRLCQMAHCTVWIRSGTDSRPLRLYYDLKDAHDRCRDAGNVKGALPWLTRTRYAFAALTACLWQLSQDRSRDHLQARPPSLAFWMPSL